MRLFQRRLWMLSLGILCLAAWAVGGVTHAENSAASLQNAWRTAGEIGRVSYRTVTVQTIHPTARLENVGRRAHTRRLEVTGSLDRPGESARMQMRSGPQANQQVMDLKLEGGLAYGRLAAGDEWRQIDGVTDFFAPGGDLLGYLSAAQNVQEIASDSRSTLSFCENEEGSLSPSDPCQSAQSASSAFYSGRGFSFDLDGPAYARYLRDQSQRALHVQEGMPANLRLDVNQVYVGMQGQGELWLDENDLPRRQVIHLRFPPARGATEWVEAEIVTDFSDWGGQVLDQVLDIGYSPGAIPPSPIPNIQYLLPNIPLTSIRHTALSLGVFLFLLAFAALAIRYRRDRRLYLALGAAVILALLTGPLVQAGQTVRYLDRQTTAGDRGVGLGDQRLATSDQESDNTNTQSPISNTQFNPRRAPFDRANTESPISNLQSLSSACTNAAATDSDGDGLNDDIECGELGTYPDRADTDSDGISDGAEVMGYPRGNPSWWLNPRNPDGNGDGIIDGIECPGLADMDANGVKSGFVYASCEDTDSDGVADVWDYDNDGDGVPDRVDSSPFAYFGDRSNGVTDSAFDFNLTFADTSGDLPVFADFELRPLDESHLWYSNTVLDWPSGDTQGQVQRIDDSTFTDLGYSGSTMDNGDLMLIPVLEVAITYDAANPAAGLPISGTVANTTAAIPNYSDLAWLDTDTLGDYGIGVNQGEDDQTLLLWVPFTQLQDDVGDVPVAWQARMVYFPQAASLGANQKMRLIWLVNAIVDTCDTSGMGADDEYDVYCALDSGRWSTSTSVIQTYYEDFFVTGLKVTEDHGGQLSLVAQKPGTGNANYEDALWHAADVLQDTYLRGLRNSDNSRFQPDDVAGYLSASELAVHTMPLAQTGDLATVASVTSTLVLNDVFGGSVAVDETVNLLYVGEFGGRGVSLGETGVSVAGDVLHPDLSNATLDVTGVVRWSPYTYQGSNVWAEADLKSYLSELSSGLSAALTDSDLQEALGGIVPGDPATVREGITTLGLSYYLSLFVGASALLQIDAIPVSTSPVDPARFGYAPASDDEAIAQLAHRLLSDIRSFYARNIYSVTANGQSVTVGGASWEELSGSVEAVAIALGNASLGVTTSATDALAAVSEYYKLAETSSDDFTGSMAISVVAAFGFGRSFDQAGGWITSGILTLKFALGVFGAVWGYQVMTGAIDLAKTIQDLKALGTFKAKLGLAWNNVKLWAVGALILAVGLALFTFFSASYENDLQRDAAIAYTTAQIIYALVIFAITLIPGVGFFIVGIIGAIDAVMLAICYGLRAGGVDIDANSNTNRWWCGGVSQAITLAIYYAVYDFTILPKLDRSDRLQIVMDTPTSIQNMADDGYIVGNEVQFRATVTTTLRMNEPSFLGYTQPYYDDQINDDILGKSSFEYRFQPSKAKISVDSNSNTWLVPAGRDDNSRKGDRLYKAANVTGNFLLTEAGVNQATYPLYFSEGYNVKVQKCGSALTLATYCWLENYKDTLHMDMGVDFVFDVYPSTIDGFMAMTEVGNDSYRLAWDSQFPTLADGDGDGLRSRSAGGVDPNDSRGDTDLDGLSDFWEYANGYDLENSDPDQDGLTDYWEAFYGTNPFAADSDGDGLGDAEEVFHPNIRYPFENSVYSDMTPPLHASSQAAWMGGWDVVYDWNAGTPLSTWVSSDPNDPDSDDDAILDGRERTYGYHPWVPGKVNLLTMRSSLQTATDSLPYVAAGGTITYTAVITNELENRYATGLLQAEFPTDQVQKTQTIDTVGPRETAAVAGALTVGLNTSQAVSMTVRAGVEFEDATERIVWLRMNEQAGSTTFSDSTFRDHHATCSGITCPAANGSYLTFSFNGGNEDFLTLPEDDDFDLASFSIGAWVRSSNASSQSTIFNDANDLRLWIANGQARVTQDGTTYATGAIISSNVWTHVMVTFDAASGAGVIYVDGVAARTYTGSAISRNNSGITLGGLFQGTLYLDEFEIYNRALSGTEVRNLVDAGPVLLAKVSGGGFGDVSPWGVAANCAGACPSVDAGGGKVNFNQTQAYRFSGNSLNLAGGGFTYATWLRPRTRSQTFNGSARSDNNTGTNEQRFSDYRPDTSSRDWQGIAGDNSAGNGSNQYPSLWVANDGKVHVRFSSALNGLCSYTTSSNLVKYNKWQQLVVSFDGSGFDFYINGELKESSGAVCTGKTLPTNSSLYVGRPNSHGYVYASYLAHAKAYDGESWKWSCQCIRIDRKDENRLEIGGVRIWSASTEGSKIYDIYSGRIIGDSDTTIHLYDKDDGKNDNYVNETINNRTLRASAGQTYGWENTGGNNFLCRAKQSCGTLVWSVSNDFYVGDLQDFRIYDYDLTAGQVQNLYDATFATLGFSFDEPPGRTVLADESGNGLDLGCVATAHTCPDTGIPGRENQALRFDGGVADDDGFDGAADYLSVADDNRLDLTSDTTIALWVKADNWNNNRYTPFLVKGSGSAANYYLGKADNNQLVFAYRDGTNFWREKRVGLSGYDTSGWLHIAVVIEPSDINTGITFYINGAAQPYDTRAGTPRTNGDALTVGRYLGSNHAAFDGLIDELAMLPFALDASEVAALVNAAPLLNLHLDEDSSSGGFADDSPGTRRLTCASDATCPAGGDKGQIREAALFDGMDKLTDSADNESRLSQFSIGLWAKPQDDTGAVQYLVERGDASRYNYRLWMAAGSFNVTFDLYNSACNARYAVTGATPLIEDQWSHLFATYDGNVMRLYINGSLSASASTGRRGACTSSSHNLTIGDGFAGNLDEIVLYGSALDGEVIAAAYAYQSAWYDVAEQHNLIVDAENPSVRLDLHTTAIPAVEQIMAVYAHDATSGVESVAYRIDGGAWTSIDTVDGSWTFNYTAITPGSHTLDVRATDRVGHTATDSRTLVVDATPPVLTIDPSLTAGVVGVGASLPISGTASDSGGDGLDPSSLAAALSDRQGIVYRPSDPPLLSGNLWSAAQPFPNAPPYGVYTLTVSAEDVAGNSGSASAALLLDGYAPVPDVIHPDDALSGSGAAITGTVADIPLPVQSKRLHLHFEESGGASFADASAQRSTATCAGGGCPGGLASGRWGRAVTFDGIDDSLSLTNTHLLSATVADSLSLAQDDFTVLAWVRANSWSGSQLVLSNDDSGTDRTLRLGVVNAAPLLDFGGNSISGPALPTGRWLLLAWRYRSLDDLGASLREQSIFVDGLPVAAAAGRNPFAGGGAFAIGGATGGAFDLDELVVYNRALSDDEIYDIANPLSTTVAAAQIRYRHRQDEDQDESAGTWYDVTLDSANAQFTTWRHTIPSTLEGPYRVDLRTTDSAGNTRIFVNVWEGEIDVYPPRVSLTYQRIGDSFARVSCRAEDYNLTDSGWECPAGDRRSRSVDDAWFTAIFGDLAKTDVYTTPLQNVAASSAQMTACDLLGQCASASVGAPTTLSEVSAILTPTNRSSIVGLDPFTVGGYAASPDGIASLTVTANGETIYTTSWSGGETAADWSFAWKPPRWGEYTLEAILTTGSGRTVSDDAETVVVIDAPEFTARKSVSPDANLRWGDSVLYTLVVTNTGTLDAAGVRITDTLPSGVSGPALDVTVNLAVGAVVTYTLPATVTNRTAFTITNSAWISHTWDRVNADATLDVCDVELVINADDSGPGSLRQRLEEVCGSGYITFAGDYAIYLDSSLAIDKLVTIDGASRVVTISGDSGNDGDADIRPFAISASTAVTLSNLSIVSGTERSTGGILNEGSLRILDSTLRDFHTVQSTGNRGSGGIILNEGVLEIERSTLAEGRSGLYGGGILNRGVLTISQSLLSDLDTKDLPRTNYGYGGAIYNDGALWLRDSIVRDSTALWGGGLFNRLGATAVVEGALFQGNASVEPNYIGGGGILNWGALIVTNTTFLSNTAVPRTRGGGGLYNNGPLTLSHSTFVGNNSRNQGSGLFNDYNGSRIYNNIFANNPGNSDCQSRYAILGDGTNVVGAGSGCGPTTAAPLLGVLGNFGAPFAGDGLTEPLLLWSLLPGSPALDAADPVYCPALDGRGQSRPGGPACDMGAFESRGFTLTLTGGDGQSALVNTAYAAPLAVVLAAVDPAEPFVGGAVSFTAPGAGPSVALSPASVTLAADGAASSVATANAIAGSLTVTATASGVLTPVTFSLVNLAPDLGLAKSVSAALTPPGQPLTYTLVFSNAGNATATGVVISDALPLYFVVSGEQSVVDGGGSVTLQPGTNRAWTVSDLPPGAGGTITVTGVVSTSTPFATVLTNTATISGSLAETITGNEGAAVSSSACWTTTRLYVDASASGQNNGQSWTDAFTHLQDALSLARNCGYATEIWVANGVYYPDDGVEQSAGDAGASFDLVSGVALYGGFAGGETQLSARDWEANVSILSGDMGQDDTTTGGVVEAVANISGTNSLNVLTASGVLTGTILDGFTITGGDGGDGAGLKMTDSYAALANLLFRGNRGNNGGGLYSSGAASGPTYDNLSFRDNDAAQGGGFYNNESPLALTGALFVDNQSTGSGGGLYNFDSPASLTAVTFYTNTAGGWGGGLYNVGSSQIVSVTFAGNQANWGGGLANGVQGSGNLLLLESSPVITNSIFVGNRAFGRGGALHNSRKPMRVVNSTLTGNRSHGVGGATSNQYTTLTLVNSILWNNSAASHGSSPFYDDSGNTDVDHSLYDGVCRNPRNRAACTDSIQYSGLSLLVQPVDPLTAPTVGGDLRLLPGAPAIDAADTSAAPAQDIQGVTRPVNAAPDMGAYESQGFRIVAGSGGGQTAIIGNQFSAPLSVTVISDAGEPVGPLGIVTFAGPGSGADMQPTSRKGYTGIDGGASLSFVRANLITGTYAITATGPGIVDWASFPLTNTRADLLLEKYVTPVAAEPGGTITYTVFFTNDGSAEVFGVVITDIVPVSVTVQSFSGDCTTQQVGGDIGCSLASLPVAAGGRLTITARLTDVVPAGFVIENSAVITSNSAGGVVGQASADVTALNVAPVLPDFSFSVDEDGLGSTVGTIGGSDANTDELTYTILNGNTGDVFGLDPATGALTVAAALDYESIPQYVLTVQASDGSLTGTGQVTVTVNNTDADVTVTKGAVAEIMELTFPFGAVAAPGKLITYTLTFKNQGRDLAPGVVLTDLIPSALTSSSVQSALDAGVTITPTPGVAYAWAISDLPVGAGGVITVSGVISPNLPLTTVVNAATIAADVDANSANNSSSVSTDSCLWDIQVTSNGDDGPGSLRQALYDICDGGTITFAGDMTIPVTSNPLEIDRGVTIDATGRTVILDGGDAMQVLALFFDTETRPVTLDHLTITRGDASEGAGGVYNGGDLTIRNSTITDNNGAYGGGGVANGGVLRLVNSLVANNGVFNGGGAGLYNGYQAQMTVENSTISGNRATGTDPEDTGGGIANWNGVITITNSTIVSNTSASNPGGGLYNDSNGVVTLSHTIVAGNVGNAAASDCYLGSVQGSSQTTHDGGYNLVGSGTGCPTDSGTTLTVDPANVFTTVLDSALADNGGDTLTHRLLLGSPAQDAGNPAGCGVTTDQRGVSRFQGAACDMGAYELDQTDLTLSKSVVPASALPGESVAFVLTVANAGSVLASGVTLTDSLPAGLTVTGIVSSGLAFTQTASSPLTWQAEIGGGASGVLTVTAAVDNDATLLGTTLTNRAGVTVSGELDASDNFAAASLTIGASPSLTLTKSVLPVEPLERGGVLTYTLVLSNTGPSAALNTRLTDTLPAEVDFAGWLVQPSGAGVTNDEITWAGTVPAGGAVTVTFTALHVGTYGDVIVNRADFSQLTASNSATVTSTVLGSQFFDLLLIPYAEEVAEGDGLTYELYLTNIGESGATGVRVSDDFSGVFTDGVTLAAGDWLQFSAVYTPTDGLTVLTNTVTVDSNELGGLAERFAITVTNVLPTLIVSPTSASLDEGASFTLTLVSLNDPGDDTVSSYTVHWGDGLTDTLTALGALAHPFADDGVYTVTVDVTDEDGVHTGRASVPVTVANLPPSAEAGGPYSVAEGGSLLLSGSGADAAADPLSFAWDLDGNGSFESSGQSVTFDAAAIDGPTAVTVTLQVDDGDGGVVTDTATVTVANLPPVVLTGPDQNAAVGETVTVTATVSDPGGDATSTTLDWGDGVTVTLGSGASLSATHSYSIAGSYPVTVTAKDDDGASATANLTVTVGAPVLSLQKSVIPTAGLAKGGLLTYTLTLSNSAAFAGLGVVLTDSLPAEVDFAGWLAQNGAVVSNDVVIWTGDAPAKGQVSVSFFARHVGDYSDVITNTARFTPVSGNGSGTVTTTVLGPPLLALSYTAETATPDEGAAVTLTVTVSNTGQSPATGVVISDTAQGLHANGVTLAAGGQVRYSYAVTIADGPQTVVYTATLVSDQTAAQQAVLALDVQNAPPILSASQSATAIDEGGVLTITLDSISDPGDDTIAGYVLGWGDGVTETVPLTGSLAIGAGHAFTHTYADGTNVYTPTLTVSDEDGEHPVAVGRITVDNVAPVLTAVPDQKVNLDELLELDAFYTDPGAEIFLAQVAWGDGQVDATSAYSGTISANHVYTATGQYTATLTLDDGDGGIAEVSFAVDVVTPELILSRGFLNIARSTPTALPGEPMIYVIRFSNGGGAPATNVRLADVMEDEAITVLGYVNSGATITQTASSPTIWEVEDLAPGAGGIITATVQISPTLSSQRESTSYAFIISNQDETNSSTALLDLTPPLVSFTQATQRVGESAGTAVVTVTLDAPNPFAEARVHVASSIPASAAATPGADYTAISQTLTIPAGQQAVTVTVPILDDALVEGDEALDLALSGPVAARLGSQATTSIVIEDDTPRISVEDVSVGEAAAATFTVTLSALNELDASVAYSTTGGTARPGLDFVAASGVITMPAGVRTVTGTIPLLDDNLDEGDEHFFVVLSDPVNGVLLDPSATVTIQDDDVAVLALSKTVTPTVGVLRSGVLTYTVILSNTSAADALSATLTDTLPANAAFGAWLENGPAAVVNGGQITWTGPISTSAALRLRYTLTHTGGYGETIVNNASFSQRSSSGTASATAQVLGAAALQLAYTVSDASPTEGDAITYTVILTNGGASPATNLTITDSLRGTLASGITLDPGQQATYRHVVQGVDGPATIVSWASVSSLAKAGQEETSGQSSRSLGVRGGTAIVSRTLTVNWRNAPPTLNVSGVATVTEGAVYTLTLGPVMDPGDDTVSEFDINWGDGFTTTVTASGQVTHTFGNGPATYTVTVTLTDEDGVWDGGTLGAWVENVPPTAAAGGPYTVDEGGSTPLAGAGTDVPGDVLAFAWDLDGDGSFESSGQNATFDAATIDGPATLTVTLQVRDEDGGATTDSVTVTVANLPPVVDAGADLSAGAGLPITVTAAVSDFPGDTHTGSVDWGDGNTEPVSVSDGITASHVYSAAGVYMTTVTVSDDDGGVGRDSLRVMVEEQALALVYAVSESRPDEGSTITYTISLGNRGTGPASRVAITNSLTGLLTESVGLAVDGQITFVFTRTVEDGPLTIPSTTTVHSDQSGTIQKALAVEVQNLPPRAGDDAATTPEDTPVLLDVLANDWDVPGDPLTLVGVGDAAGRAKLDGGRPITLTPALPIEVEAFTGAGDLGAAATPDERPLPPPPLADKQDTPGAPLRLKGVDQPAGGAELGNSGRITYTPALNFYGTDVFTYTVADDDGGRAIGTVTVTVTPVNDPPVLDAIPDQSDYAGAAVALQLQAADVDSAVLTYTVSGLPPGLAIGSDTGAIAGQLPPGSAGVYTVTATVSDGELSDSRIFVWRVRRVRPLYLPWLQKWTPSPPPGPRYLPLVYGPLPRYSDLRVEAVYVEHSSLRVVIFNDSGVPVTQEFWVDLYVNPARPPERVNETWDVLGDEGGAWGVTAGALSIAPGGRLTLTVGGPFYSPTHSYLSGPLVAGTVLYAQVDSWNGATTYGAVLESHEATGGAYNNILGPVILAENVTRLTGDDTGVHPQGRALPPRPAIQP